MPGTSSSIQDQSSKKLSQNGECHCEERSKACAREEPALDPIGGGGSNLNPWRRRLLRCARNDMEAISAHLSPSVRGSKSCYIPGPMMGGIGKHSLPMARGMYVNAIGKLRRLRLPRPPGRWTIVFRPPGLAGPAVKISAGFWIFASTGGRPQPPSYKSAAASGGGRWYKQTQSARGYRAKQSQIPAGRDGAVGFLPRPSPLWPLAFPGPIIPGFQCRACGTNKANFRRSFKCEVGSLKWRVYTPTSPRNA
jgi:hypothetical protein